MENSQGKLDDTMFNEYPDIVSVYQMVEMLGIGLTVAYKLLKAGEIKHKKIGRNYKIPKQSIIQYVLNN